MKHLLLTGFLLIILASGCQPMRKFAMNQVAGIISSSSQTFYQDEDPQLVRDSLPFAMKLMEGTLTETPRHRGLLLQCASTFTQYGYGFIKQDADEIEEDDYRKAKVLRNRAKKLLLRGRDYGLRGLELSHPNLALRLSKDPIGAVAALRKRDVDLIYWAAVAWGGAISLGKDDPHLIADQVIVEELLDRALELDEAYDSGAIHEALISYEMARQGGKGKPEDRAKIHFDRALVLAQGERVGPFVALAESVCVKTQNRKEFERLLGKALTVDTNKNLDSRTINLVMQRRARWLLTIKDDLFLE